MNDNNEVKLVAENIDGLPIIYRDSDPAYLKIRLTNETESAIELVSGENACGFNLYFPVSITEIELENMTIDEEGWSCSVDKIYCCLNLTYVGVHNKYWIKHTDIVFTVREIVTQAQTEMGVLQVNLLNFPQRVQPQVMTPLTISEPSKPGNASLKDVLQVSLDNQGMIFVSKPNDKLSNTFFLNIKNIGTTPIYKGISKRGNPKVTVMFVYGIGSGCLAPDKSTIADTSAWDIKATIPYVQPENSWQAVNPSQSLGDEHPKWVLNPSAENKGIIGINDNANVTFSFSEIISITPPGHTQAVIQFTGFWKDEHIAYDDAVFVVDIVKVNVPLTRGLFSFFSENAVIDITNSNVSTTVTVKWVLFNVSRLTLLTSSPMINPIQKDITDRTPITYGELDFKLGTVSHNTSFIITALAYDGSGAFLNSMQFTVFIRANFFKDPRDGALYPAVVIDSQLWMSKNLNYEPVSGSKLLGAEAKYGRLYQWGVAQAPDTVEGWRLPNCDDWQKLINNYENAKKAYEQLIEGGESGFDALLNGVFRTLTPEHFDISGYYWTSKSKSQENAEYITISSVSKSVFLNSNWDKKYYLSVRYVKDI